MPFDRPLTVSDAAEMLGVSAAMAGIGITTPNVTALEMTRSGFTASFCRARGSPGPRDGYSTYCRGVTSTSRSFTPVEWFGQ